MKVFVKTLKGSHFDIEVQPEDSVAYVKKYIEIVQGSDVYPAVYQILIYQGKVLKDATTLDENKVAENSFLVIMLTKSKGSSSRASTTSVAPTTQVPIYTLPPTGPIMHSISTCSSDQGMQGFRQNVGPSQIMNQQVQLNQVNMYMYQQAQLNQVNPDMYQQAQLNQVNPDMYQQAQLNQVRPYTYQQYQGPPMSSLMYGQPQLHHNMYQQTQLNQVNTYMYQQAQFDQVQSYTYQQFQGPPMSSLMYGQPQLHHNQSMYQHLQQTIYGSYQESSLGVRNSSQGECQYYTNQMTNSYDN